MAIQFNNLRCLTLIVALSSACATAVHSADFRIYTVNKQMQQSRAFKLSDGGESGCHNLLVKQRAHRVAQVGFERCTIYAERDCQTGSELTVRWKNEKKPTTEITQGARWFLEGKRGTKMASWHCQAKGEPKK